MTKLEEFLTIVSMIALVLFFAFIIGVFGFSILARLGIGTETYCYYLASQEDVFCIVRKLK